MADTQAKVLTGEHIILRKARMTDLDAVHANIYSDAVLLDSMFLRITRDRTASEERLRRTIAFQADKPVFFAVRRDTDEVIGLGGMCEESPGVYSETGLCIARKAQRRGYAAEMLALLLAHAFVDCGAAQFVYYCMDTNVPSRSLALRFGFRFDSAREQIRDYDGRVFRVERYVLDREDYMQQSRTI